MHCKNLGRVLWDSFPPGSSSTDTSKISVWTGHVTCGGGCTGNSHNGFAGGMAELAGKRCLNIPLNIWNTPELRFGLGFHEAAHVFGALGDHPQNPNDLCIVSGGDDGGEIWRKVNNGQSNIFCTVCATQIRAHLLSRF